MDRPLPFFWDGEAFIPRLPRVADKLFVVGETYPLIVQEERSRASHSHFFASVTEAWKNLREEDCERFPSADHLRKRALIEAGYFDEDIIDCGSNKVAPTIAAQIRKRDDFALIVVRDQFVIVRTAKSQSMRAMGKKAFGESKDAVLGILANMVGVQPAQLQHEAGRAA